MMRRPRCPLNVALGSSILCPRGEQALEILGSDARSALMRPCVPQHSFDG